MNGGGLGVWRWLRWFGWSSGELVSEIRKV